MNALILPVVLPLFVAFLLPIVYQRYAVERQGEGYAALSPVITMLLSMVFILTLWHGNQAVGPQSLALGGFPAPVGIVFYADSLAIIFLLALVFSLLALWLGKDQHETRQETLWLLVLGGGSGMLLSADLFNIYVFFEIVAVASYGLAARLRTPEAFAASLRFLLLGAAGSAMMLLGIALIYGLTGTLNLSHLAIHSQTLLHTPTGIAAFMLILLGLAVKAELFPVNTWVPEVYAHTSPRISALLAGVVSKLAILVALRLLTLLYADTPAHLFLLILGILSVVSGEAAAYRATTLRQMLAFSSIGQLGLVAIAFSIPGEAGILAGIALALHHLLVKSALFMLTGPWGGPMTRLIGVVHVAPGSVFLFALLSLSLIGIPPLPGFWAKFLLVKGAFATHDPWMYFAIFLVMASTVVETAYFVRVLRRMFQSNRALNTAFVPTLHDLKPVLMFTAVLLLSIIFIEPVLEALTEAAHHAADTQLYLRQTLPAWQQPEW